MNWQPLFWALAAVLMAWNLVHVLRYYVHKYKYALRQNVAGLDPNFYRRCDEFAEEIHVNTHIHQVNAVGVIYDPKAKVSGTFIFGLTSCDFDNLERAVALEHAARLIIEHAIQLRDSISEPKK